MKSYKFLEDWYQLKIIKGISKENKTVEIDAKSHFFQNLFFTKKERFNNNIVSVIFQIIIIALIVGYFPIAVLLLGEKLASSPIISGCSSIFILTGIIIILAPIFITLKRLFITINIKLIFSPKGLEMIPNAPKKKPIFIESLNISKIYVKESKIIDTRYTTNTLTRTILNLILKLHKPITNPLTNENIEEIILVEDIIDEKDLKQITKFSEEIQEALELKDM